MRDILTLVGLLVVCVIGAFRTRDPIVEADEDKGIYMGVRGHG